LLAFTVMESAERGIPGEPLRGRPVVEPGESVGGLERRESRQPAGLGPTTCCTGGYSPARI